MTSVHRATIDLLLAAVHQDVGDDGMSSSFFFGATANAPHWEKRISTEIFFSLKRMILAALFVRRHGPPYVRSLSIDAIREMLQKFLTDNFHDVGRETFLKPFSESFAHHVSSQTKDALAASLAISPLFSPVNELTLFPLVPFKVEAPFTCASFFIRSPASLLEEFDAEDHAGLSPETFPPFRNYEHKTEKPNAWLGVRAPVLGAARKMSAAILGAAALTSRWNHRHMFTGRKMFGGRCTISADNWSMTYSGRVTPALGYDLVIRPVDAPWLDRLAGKLSSSVDTDRRHIRALEYFYRSWALEESERFPVQCMALDALYSDPAQATASVVDGVRMSLGEHIDEARLKLLMAIRGSVIHGGAPDVYDSRKYAKYYSKYGDDPIDDLSDLTIASLKKRVFDDTVLVQEDPDAALMIKLQQEGRIPLTFGARGILGQRL